MSMAGRNRQIEDSVEPYMIIIARTENRVGQNSYLEPEVDVWIE